MKKTNLIILLLVPFIIALLGVVTINTTYNLIDNDILSISWEYDDNESFKLGSSSYELKATGVNQKNYPAGTGNDLVWTVKNKDPNDSEVHAEIEKYGNQYYLKPISCGEVIVTCTNQKGNVTRYMYVTIYNNGVLLIQPKDKGSQSNVDTKIYYGEYDLKNTEKVKATFAFEIKASPESIKNDAKVEAKSDNISVDLAKGIVTINAPGSSYFTIGCGDESIASPVTYSFEVVDEGVNVYTYDDLLECTNRSVNGEIVVLRKSFESFENTYSIASNGDLVSKDDRNQLFGTYNMKTKKFDFDSEVYRFTTTFNKNFIDQWNSYIRNSGSTNFISDQVIAGLRVQKDFYGNGYTINLHNLAYPSSTIDSTDANGNIVKIPYLASSDLFRGPLPFYTLGDHNNMPLVEAFGQDNIGMYVDGDNITVNDVNLKNCDFGNMLANLNYAGTVMEISGDNVTVKNSRLANGKHVLRCFSSMNVLIDNCMLSNARNFLVNLGSNEYIPVDDVNQYEFIDETGKKYTDKISTFFEKDAPGDVVLNNYLLGNYADNKMMKDALLLMQEIFNDEDKVKDIYKGKVTINDSLFYQSGIASISLETMFNGPFLYTKTPSMIAMILDMLQTQDGVSLGDFRATNVGGLSYPIELTLSGKTKFYDYKDINNVDISGLINENISKFAQSIKPDYEGLITIDDIFPIKTYLINKASGAGSIYSSEEKRYINIPIAYYGGGLNLSKVNIDSLEGRENYGSKLAIDMMDNYLSLGGGGDSTLTLIKNMMLKAVVVVTGYEPFNFVCVKGNGYLYGETPKVSDLIENVKGE